MQPANQWQAAPVLGSKCVKTYRSRRAAGQREHTSCKGTLQCWFQWCDLQHPGIFTSDFITGLLQNIGTHVDPIILIQKIRSGMEIPGLRDSLVKILQDYNLQVLYA